MDRGIYASASGGLLNSLQLEIVGNNLANVSTVGYKAERIVARQQDFTDTLANTINQNNEKAKGDQDRTPGVVELESVTDFSPGPLQSTGNPLHVALQKKNQFFVVDTPEGEAYTKAGNFTINSEGYLSTSDGMQVLGDGGAITLGIGQTQITSNGTVMSGNTNVGRLRVVEIDDLSSLRRTGGTRFASSRGAAANTITPDLVTESLEMPNVSVVESMVQMIATHRAFEGYSKTVKTINELNERAIRSARTSG